jgi:hypothetical protein
MHCNVQVPFNNEMTGVDWLKGRRYFQVWIHVQKHWNVY